MDESTLELELPGFRFHPTEEELLGFYLKNMISGKKLGFDIIAYLNIYHHDPWDLPGLAIGEREWYFYVPRDRRHGSGGRPNRITKNGFWKATGSDRKILSLFNPRKMIGLKKTLVFYKGRAPRGSKTDWIMNEYRLPDTSSSPKDMVLCKIYRKATSLKVLEQRAAMEEERKSIQSLITLPAASPPSQTISFCGLNDELAVPQIASHHMIFKKEDEELVDFEAKEYSSTSTTTTTTTTATIGSSTNKCNAIQLPTGSRSGSGSGRENLGELQVPRLSLDWTQDSFWTQLRSPWFENWIPYASLQDF